MTQERASRLSAATLIDEVPVWISSEELMPESGDDLTSRINHLDEDAAARIRSALKDSNVVAKSLSDLRPALSPVEHGYELEDGRPIH